MDLNILEFLTVIIGALAERLELPVSDIYRRLSKSGILREYMIPSYDVLHTFSIPYVVDDLVDYMQKKGALA